MALRHAVLAVLLDEELSGYQLAKAFDVSVANFWHALPQQLYVELAKLAAAADGASVEIEGFVREVTPIRKSEGKLVTRLVLFDPSSGARLA